MDRSKSLQEVFSTVAVHLLRQNARASGLQGSCYYRTGNGLMCAIGKLITQQAYTPALENNTIASFAVQDALFLSGVDTATSGMHDMLNSLQQLHDRAPVSTWADGLASIAKRHNLSMPNTSDLLSGYIAAPVEPTKPTKPVARLSTEVPEEELAL